MVRKLEENSRLFRIVVDLVQSMQVRKLDTVCAVAKAALYGLYVVEGAQGFRRSPALTRSLICCKFWLPDAKHAASTLPEEVRDLHLPRTDRFDTQEFDTIARLETQAIDAYNDAHHYRAENPLAHLHEDEAPVETDKLKSFH